MKKEAAPKENAFVSLLANIVVPALILTKGAKLCARLFGAEPSAALVLVVALAFPTGYFVLDYLRRRELNWISAVGFAGTLLTGGIGLFRLSPFFFVLVLPICASHLRHTYQELMPKYDTTHSKTVITVNTKTIFVSFQPLISK